jgi:hypothetical protein
MLTANDSTCADRSLDRSPSASASCNHETGADQQDDYQRDLTTSDARSRCDRTLRCRVPTLQRHVSRDSRVHGGREAQQHAGDDLIPTVNASTARSAPGE